MPKKRQVVYFAHAMCTYGTPQERAELDAIRRGIPGCRIINPAGYDQHPEKKRAVLDFCLRLIEKSNGVVFSRLLGKITVGVGAEINHALGLGLEVFELRPDERAEEWVFREQRRPVKYIDHPATIALYRKYERSLFV